MDSSVHLGLLGHASCSSMRAVWCCALSAQARQLLFFPSAQDMAKYPKLMAAAPAGSPDSHPQAKMRVLALSLLYLVHSRTWSRAKPFAEAGGLRCVPCQTNEH